MGWEGNLGIVFKEKEMLGGKETGLTSTNIGGRFVLLSQITRELETCSHPEKVDHLTKKQSTFYI